MKGVAHLTRAPLEPRERCDLPVCRDAAPWNLTYDSVDPRINVAHILRCNWTAVAFPRSRILSISTITANPIAKYV
jgi:hypothetical protein